ncbi:monovalent cation/proton antiporter, MnhG/PhaG subunit [Methanomethylovorans hollandica DSM 15978]|uniref:Monovalent cation/proton antiporter, MnhG/PhaG subunit n=1 Tax=Methanomethylovorans hollandica (strain DSM 15978 / NBRC 107637 / DMS1) TaxID=867904 RepID=L0KWP6_METHD|nr:monovalent cation/H(+) antiporter subunit G [Methanomethylovorans hollandica]AGB49852.1 monovalent cation/proton antiporter, MnhG/PhaG subunit [Methanomethylovorans hollandica DSM 15978]
MSIVGIFSMIMNILSDIVLLIGLVFVFLGMLGLMRMPDVYNRLHTTSKIGTVGAFGVMLSILMRAGFTPIGIKAITVGLFLLLTAPIAAHMITRAAHRHGVGLCKESVIDEYGKACERCKK